MNVGEGEIGRASLGFVNGQWHARIARGSVGCRHVVPLGKDLGRRQKRAAAERADKIRRAIKSPATFTSDEECNDWIDMMRGEISGAIIAASDFAEVLHDFSRYDDVRELGHLLSAVLSAQSAMFTRHDTHEARVARAERMRVMLTGAGRDVKHDPSAVAIGDLAVLNRTVPAWTVDLGAVFAKAGMKAARS